MAPNKSKRPACREEGEDMERKTKRPRPDVEEEDAEISGGGLRSPVSSHNKPAELFRKDLISAMKLADSDQLDVEDYLLISDPWRQDWEKGVQVPVNEERVNEADAREIKSKDKGSGDFKIPKKYLHSLKDETFQQGIHEFTGMQQLADQVVRYDLDDFDVCWLNRANEMREELSEILIDEWVMEMVIEALETQCHENMQLKKKTEEGLGIEYDEDIVCAVCASPESEECNEMVFCDGCDICVHQACYGIQKIPEGSWLCRTCALGIKPTCILCPKSGGAMKSTRSGTKWAHVNCALWIPEVSIGCVEKMEPVTKISQIPASRWSLICCVCKERCGACIQCSVKACKTAFHVSCAFQNNLEMRTQLTDEMADDGGVKLKAYCPRHSKKGERRLSESDSESPRKSIGGSPRKELTDEEIAKMRAEKMLQLNEDFYKNVNVEEIASKFNLDESAVETIFVYWKLKRKAHFDVPMLTPKTEEEDLLEKQQEDSLLARMKMFVQLRQDLERVRNLCYMVSKREKVKKQFYKEREAVFFALNSVLTDENLHLNNRDAKRIANKYRFNSIYDTKIFETIKLPAESEVESCENEPVKVEIEIPSKPETQDLLLMPVHQKSPIKVERRGRKSHVRKRKKSEMTSVEDNVESSKDIEMSDPESLPAGAEIAMPARTRTRDKSPEKQRRKSYIDGLDPADVQVNRRSRRESFTKAERELRKSIRIDSDEELSIPKVPVFSSKAGQVTDKVKNEVNRYIQSSTLVIPDKIRNKLHKGLLANSKQITNIADGYVKKSLDSFLNGLAKTKSPLPKSPISRVLNEISPGRTRHGSSNSLCRSRTNSPKGGKNDVIQSSLEKGNIDIPRETRSVRRRIDNVFDVFHLNFGQKGSRENSPDNFSDTVRSMRQVRSLSPASSLKSLAESHGDYVDVENIFHESENTHKRITRSQGLDSAENSRDSFCSLSNVVS